MRFQAAVCLLAIIAPLALMADPDIAPTITWDVETSRLSPFAIDLRRGETAVLRPTYLSYGVPMDLSAAHLVTMEYRASSADLPMIITGQVVSATSGVVSIRWTSANEWTNSTYSYDIEVQSMDAMLCRCFGRLRLQGSVSDPEGTQAVSRVFTYIDWAKVDSDNIGMAPFLSSFNTADIDEFIDGCLDGSESLDLAGLTVRGPLIGSAGQLTNFPAYLARSGDIPQGVVTNLTKGEVDPSGGSVTRVGNNAFVIRFPSMESGELSQTNRLWWLIDGVPIGYVTTNGIVMLQGSLQLYEEDLDCNVRAYDGSATAPSVTFYASPQIGWYRKSYSGSYAWAYAHNSNDVALIGADGITLFGNARFSGSGGGLIGVPEPIHDAWVTNARAALLRVTNAFGSVTAGMYGTNGAVTVRGQDSDARYLTWMTNGVTGSITTYTHNAGGSALVTNVWVYSNGWLRAFTAQ